METWIVAPVLELITFHLNPQCPIFQVILALVAGTVAVVAHRVFCQIPTEAENTHLRFLHFRMPLDMGENLAPILGRSPSATHTKKFQKTEN